MNEKEIIEELRWIYEILDEEACEKGMEATSNLIEKLEAKRRNR